MLELFAGSWSGSRLAHLSVGLEAWRARYTRAAVASATTGYVDGGSGRDTLALDVIVADLRQHDPDALAAWRARRVAGEIADIMAGVRGHDARPLRMLGWDNAVLVAAGPVLDEWLQLGRALWAREHRRRLDWLLGRVLDTPALADAASRAALVTWLGQLPEQAGDRAFDVEMVWRRLHDLAATPGEQGQAFGVLAYHAPQRAERHAAALGLGGGRQAETLGPLLAHPSRHVRTLGLRLAGAAGVARARPAPPDPAPARPASGSSGRVAR